MIRSRPLIETPSQEIFRLRKEGKIDEATTLGRERARARDRDDWDVRALSWCLIDLIKRSASERDLDRLNQLTTELRELPLPTGDDVLEKQRLYALSLVQTSSRELQRAREHSRAGRHRDAIAIYADLLRKGELPHEAHDGYGWDLCKTIGQILGAVTDKTLSEPKAYEARQLLNTYMKLKTTRPSNLHSAMLQKALRLAEVGRLRLAAFARLWDLQHLRSEDFERFVSSDGHTGYSLAEKVVRRAVGDATENHQREALDYLYPFLERLMWRFPDNLWLAHSSAKSLRELGRLDEARSLALGFAKAKSQEYWAWELLGDLQEDPDLRLACYCKGLLCSQDDAFVGGLRLKLAGELGRSGHAREAVAEVVRVKAYKESAGHRIPREIEEIRGSSWFTLENPVETSPAFYGRFAKAADELLFADLPWIEACMGETFVVPGDKPKPKRKIYLRDRSMPLEVSIPENRLKIRRPIVGQPIRIKADLGDRDRRFQLYAIEERSSGAAFDVFEEVIGVVDHVNSAKGVFHFVAGRESNGTAQMKEHWDLAKLGTYVRVRFAKYQSPKGDVIRAVTLTASPTPPTSEICRNFRESVSVDGKLGFTDNGIFIPPDLVEDHEIMDGDIVSGTAVLTFNKKRQTWGLKAILVEKPSRSS